MINHTDLGSDPFSRLRALQAMIENGKISLGGNKRDKIYGKLSCRAGKRMKPENRVFFADEAEAIATGYRPCAVCAPNDYKLWKQKAAD